MPSHSSPFHRADEPPQPEATLSPEELQRKAEVIQQLRTLREPTLQNESGQPGHGA